MKKKLILAMFLTAFTAQAEETQNDYTTLTGDKYVLDIHDTVSGGIISIFNLVQNNKSGKVQIRTEKEIQVETKIEYKDNPETQAKLAKFKQMLNDKLQSNELSQTFYYKTANATLSDKQVNYLSNVVLSLNEYESLQYQLKGYSDTRGNAEYNKGLSLSRINGVVSILKQLNVATDNIVIDNKGDTLSEENAGYEDLFFDRKVELIITKK
jgi:outer membrane protein OmpA-like peptidoglycan-associated protein